MSNMAPSGGALAWFQVNGCIGGVAGPSGGDTVEAQPQDAAAAVQPQLRQVSA